MNRNLKNVLYGVIAVIAIMIITGIYRKYNSGESSMYSGGQNTKKRKIAIIVKSTESSFWKSVRAGAEAAATEYNVDIYLEGPANEEDYKSQNAMINRAVKNKVDAIIFSAVDYEANAEAINMAAEKGIHVIGIDSDVNSSKVLCRIGTDNYEAGVMMAEAVLEWKETTGYDCNVGIVNFDKNSANGQERERGFSETIEDKEILIIDSINVNSTIKDAKNGTKEMIIKYPEINVIVTMNEWTSLGVGYAIEDMDIADSTCVIAFDSNIVSVEMLESCAVDGLIVQNPYAMGYLGVESACSVLNGKKLRNDNINTSTLLIDRDNMYEVQCQRALFSFEED